MTDLLSSNQVQAGLAWISQLEIDRENRGAGMSTKPPAPMSTMVTSSKTMEIRGTKRLAGRSADVPKSRKLRVVDDSGFWGSSSGSAAAEEEVLRAEVERLVRLPQQ